MAVVITLATMVLLALIVLVVSAPLREAAARRAGGGEPERGAGDAARAADARAHERERLEAARESKYREIRDAELDYRTGKLSEGDYRELDAELRAEALAILDALEAGGATPRDASAGRSRSRRTKRRRRPSSG